MHLKRFSYLALYFTLAYFDISGMFAKIAILTKIPENRS
jgi:hypothetical protein